MKSNKLTDIRQPDLTQLFLVFHSEYILCTCSCTVGKTQVPFSMVIGNGELMHECFPKHLRMGTARMKYDKETDEDGKTRGVSMERSRAGTKKRIRNGLSHPNQNIIIINKIL